MTIFKIIYWAGLLIEIAIRAPIQKIRKTTATTERRATITETVLLGLLTVGGFVVPLIYSVTNWLAFADYRLPAWMGWAGALLLVCAVVIFALGHRDLKSNWSPTLEVYQGHTLITNGIYGYIRHPMYASQWVMAAAEILLLQNWLAGPIGLVVFIPFYFLRVRAEEKMMLDTFGEQYRKYMNSTGGVIPRL